MFVRRSLSLNPQQPSLAEPVLRRECFEEVALASQCLARAEEKARALLADAQEQADEVLAEAQARFWAQANQVLEAWEAERQAQREAVVEQARQLVNETLASLLGTFTLEERALALIRQLDQGQKRPIRATLRCAIDIYPAMESVLRIQPHAYWDLESDLSLANGTLLLGTDSGDLSLDWGHFRESLLILI